MFLTYWGLLGFVWVVGIILWNKIYSKVEKEG